MADESQKTRFGLIVKRKPASKAEIAYPKDPHDRAWPYSKR